MSDTSTSFPHRNIDRLYCPCVTYLCAIGKHQHQPSEEQNKTSQPCIPCAYKACNFDIALDKEFTKLVPNQRPEVCPRSATTTKTTASNDDDDSNNNVDGMMGYRRGMNVLTVGDGDFSFSLAVSKLVASADNNSGGMVVATSYEDKPTLQRVYPAFEDTLNSLQNCDGTKTIVGYNVDATQLNKTLPPNVLQSNVKYHRICWNFPCTAIGKGQDGQNDAMEENKELVRKFMVNALPFLDIDCGEIHIAHKTKPPYNQWEMEKIAMEGINKNGNENFEYLGRLVFDKLCMPPYTPRKALDRKSFPCHDACIYIFGFRRTSGEGSTIPCGEDADNDELSIQQLAKLSPSSVIPVTTQLIIYVRSIHMKLAVYRQEVKQRSKKRSGNEHHGRKKQRRRK